MLFQKKSFAFLTLLIVLAFFVVPVSASENKSNMLFLLGEDMNEDALQNVSLDVSIASELNLQILGSGDSIPPETNFSDYEVIFIDSWSEIQLKNLEDEINASASNGSTVIGYNLSPSFSLAKLDLRDEEFRDIERYWIQGGSDNMENLLIFMGQKFCGKFRESEIGDVQVIKPKVDITLIFNNDPNVYCLNKIKSERPVIADCFNITAMTGKDAVNLQDPDFSDQEAVILYIVSNYQLSEFGPELLSAQNTGTLIGFIGMSSQGGITNDIKNIDFMEEYLKNGGMENMENLVRYTGKTLFDTYIDYQDPNPPSIPKQGIYHPDAFPYIFENSDEYLEWYTGHGYDPSAPTIGIVSTGALRTDEIDYLCDDAIIRDLESKGCNVIDTTSEVCSQDVDYFTKNGTVLVDVIINLKMFRLNYYQPEIGVEYLEKYNVPVIKAIADYYSSPSEYNNSSFGMNPNSVPSQVNMPELDGCIEGIWIGGRVQEPETERYYYAPHLLQVDWLGNRAIEWAELGRTRNQDKKVVVIYYNHEGGKNNIGASYLDIAPSFTLLLEQMKSEGYDLGNGSIPNGSEFIKLFIDSRNIGSWTPGELEKMVNSVNVTLVPVEDYLVWYNTLPEEVRKDVENTWGEPPGDIMVYEDCFVIPAVNFGNIVFMPQPTRGGLSDESKIYHNKTMPPTHQYLAAYFWVNKVFDADAFIHFGTHSTQEWLPGKQVGLSRYDYPCIMVDDTPVIYPYIMDDVGEGTQAKRRGNAVIIDHLTPPIVTSGLYDELSTLHEKIHSYMEADNQSLKVMYRNTTIELYGSLGLEDDLNITCSQMENMTETEFENFVDTDVHNYLHELKSTLIPYGLHVFGEAPENEELVSMIKSLLGSEFIDHIADVISYEVPDSEAREEVADAYATDLLNAVLLEGMDYSGAQLLVLNTTDPKLTEDLETAENYSALLALSTREIDQTLRALDAGYIEAGPGNDPIRNPEALPTGRNFYSFDQRMIPSEETEILGGMLADQLLKNYQASHNNLYPKKVGFVLWSTETMRHEGLMEAQIYALLGVKPVRDSSGRITDIQVIPAENLTHPRIDVLITASGLYRDTFSYQIEMIDRAVLMVSELNETNQTNYVRHNSLVMYDALIDTGYDNSSAFELSRSRIFSEAPGDYGTGLTLAIPASGTWDNESKLAELYISRLSSIYGSDVWGENSEDTFRLNLMDVDAALHSDSSNLYGLMDNDDFYQYFGGLTLAVRSVKGENPELYVANLQDTENPEIASLKEVFRTELRSRYLNPMWIEGMMDHEYGGAREFGKLTEYMWAWDVVTPDLVTDRDWENLYDIYINDKYGIGVSDFLKNENAYTYQSITARMLENVRKGYWEASDEITQQLVKEYVESVVENGVTCCHHTCGNPLLDDYIRGVISAPNANVVDTDVMEDYERLMAEARGETLDTDSPEGSKHSSSTGAKAEVVSKEEYYSENANSTLETGSGVGTDLTRSPKDKTDAKNEYIEGYEMTKEKIKDDVESDSMPFSASDLVGMLLLLLLMGAVFVGYGRKKN
ncbi:TPA: cobaltochelatase subunit CobN [Methanosarcina acetivorans]|uniref:Cobaltochelatase subunit CobN n=1 Tax=Methanosarcina acetivorans TaxID=2214 RepID=A0A832SLR7_9EURY|nr:cobaltochelatase subunit CobN [Methanosarcina acetivorans]HIH95437.1 cobaltochelatase subunit CobN [Methanosarcina acetivorans]